MWISKQDYYNYGKRCFQKGIDLGYDVCIKRQAYEKCEKDIIACMHQNTEEEGDKRWEEIKRMLEQ